MKKVTFDYSKALGFFSEAEIGYMETQVNGAVELLHSKTGAGNDFLGWMDLPVNYDKAEFARIKAAAEKVKNNSDVLIVIGIGGSYLGARAVIEALNHPFSGFMKKGAGKGPIIVYAGNSISQDYHSALLELLDEKDYVKNIARPSK